MDLWSIGRGSIWHGYMCILLYMKLIGCSSFAWIYGQLVRGPSAMGICAFCYIWKLLDVVVLHGSMVNWWGSICHGYMCILLYMKVIGCSSFAWIYGQLVGVHLPWVYVHSAIWHLLGVVVLHGSMVNWQGDPSAMGICAFCYIWNMLGVAVVHGSMVNW